MKGIFFAISGPSGVGKGTLIAKFKQEFPRFVFPISHTTRERRPEETDGQTYNFISVFDFQREIEEGNFFEWAIVHEKNYYGTLKKPIMGALEEGEIVMREVDMQGIASFRKILAPENLVTIFIYPEKFELLRLRIEKRGKLPEEEIQRRLKSAQYEIELGKECDYQILSMENGIEECYNELKKIIVAEATKVGINV